MNHLRGAEDTVVSHLVEETEIREVGRMKSLQDIHTFYSYNTMQKLDEIQFYSEILMQIQD